MRFHGPNVVICEVVTGRKRSPLISIYLPPSTLDHLPNLEEALTCFRYQDSIVLGDLNTKIQSHSPGIQKFNYLLMEFRMVDLLHYPFSAGVLTHENVVSGATRQIVADNT